MAMTRTLLVCPRGNDRHVTLNISLPKQGTNTEENSTQNTLNVAPMLQMNNMQFFTKKEKCPFVFGKEKGYCSSQRVAVRVNSW